MIGMAGRGVLPAAAYRQPRQSPATNPLSFRRLSEFYGVPRVSYRRAFPHR